MHCYHRKHSVSNTTLPVPENPEHCKYIMGDLTDCEKVEQSLASHFIASLTLKALYG